VLTGDGGVAERRRTRGNERWRLELVARGSAREGWPGGVTVVLMALMPLKAGVRLRGGLRRGEVMAGW
jgi:hypothetical protein